MRLTALVDGPEHVCCRYRVAAFRPFLEAAGHSLDLHPWPRPWWSRWRLLRELRGTEALLIQRRLLPGWQVALLRRAARFLLFDFDDAVFLRDSYAPRGPHSPRRLRRFAGVTRAADAAVAGNTFLRDAAARWAGAGRVEVIPTCVDPERYPVAEHLRAGEGVQLVWIGSSSTLRGLEAVRPLLEEVGRRCPGLRLKLVCDRFLELRHLPVLACPWSEAREAPELAAADVGISWVPDDDWSRGKCGLKVLQYMAAGLPVVANPVGVQAEIVRHGETGFLVDSPEGWAAAVGRLARDPALRRRMGKAGRRVVEAEYSVRAGAARWLALLE
ncbi:MAG TPA: glycosyltransferase family 4 protein, partial [Gemmataceae bacterium]|nr:glycosyltransferase family 4 protein [Gemmataceae bacterium]